MPKKITWAEKTVPPYRQFAGIAGKRGRIIKEDEDDAYEPKICPEFLPTAAVPGSLEKIEVMRQRIERGNPLWHPGDRVDFAGAQMTGIRLIGDKVRMRA